MGLLPSLSDDLLKAVEELGVPLPVSAPAGIFLLLEIQFSHSEENGYTARIPGVAAIGEGETEEEAALALREALRGYLEAFG
jgi:hypothetical protein